MMEESYAWKDNRKLREEAGMSQEALAEKFLEG